MLLISSVVWATDASTVTEQAFNATLEEILVSSEVITAIAKISTENQQAASSAARNAASAVLQAVYSEALAAATASANSAGAAVASSTGATAGRVAGAAAGAAASRIPGIGGLAGRAVNRATSTLVDAASQDAILLAVRNSAQTVFTAARPDAVNTAIAAVMNFN